ncbi:hypothetical protein D3C79_1001420 [compost metagenome]
MIGADHQAMGRAGDGVLGDHAHARLGVAEHEVHRHRMFAFEGRHFIGQGFDRRTDVHGVALVRLDEIH